MVIRFDIPLVPPSLNQLLGWHWSKKHRVTKAWEEALHHGISKQFATLMKEWGRSKMHTLINVTVFSARRRELDEDNLFGGFKPCLDSTKRLGYIYDDSKKYVRVFFTQQYEPDPRKHRTAFEVMEDKPF